MISMNLIVFLGLFTGTTIRWIQYNMLEHLGKQSTFSGRGQRHVGNCGSKLMVFICNFKKRMKLLK